MPNNHAKPMINNLGFKVHMPDVPNTEEEVKTVHDTKVDTGNSISTANTISPSGAVRHLLLALLWLLPIVILYGVDKGDLLDEEAVYLLEARQLQRGTSVTPATVYARLLALGPITPDSAIFLARIFSVSGMLATWLLLLFWIGPAQSRLPQAMAGLVFLATPVGFLLSTRIGPDAWIACLMVLAAFCMARAIPTLAFHTTPWRGVALLALAFLALAGAASLTIVTDDQGWARTLEDRLLSPWYTLAVALPWSLIFVTATRKSFWTDSFPRGQGTMIAALALALISLMFAYLLPRFWLAAGLLLASAQALAMGCVWQRWLENSLASEVARTQRGITNTLVIGLPALLVALTVWRIGQVYPFMERVQAVFVVALACLIVAVRVRARHPIWHGAVYFALVVTTKIVYVHAYLPERDQWTSARPQARALGQHLPAGATLHTAISFPPAYQYYLQARLASLQELNNRGTAEAAESESTTELGISPLALVAESSLDRLPGGERDWRIARIFETGAGEPLYLMRAATEAVDLRRSAALPAPKY